MAAEHGKTPNPPLRLHRYLANWNPLLTPVGDYAEAAAGRALGLNPPSRCRRWPGLRCLTPVLSSMAVQRSGISSRGSPRAANAEWGRSGWCSWSAGCVGVSWGRRRRSTAMPSRPDWPFSAKYSSLPQSSSPQLVLRGPAVLSVRRYSLFAHRISRRPTHAYQSPCRRAGRIPSAQQKWRRPQMPRTWRQVDPNLADRHRCLRGMFGRLGEQGGLTEVRTSACEIGRAHV